MPVNPELVGREFPPTPPYLVGREKVREFARAVLATSPLNLDPDAARAAGYADVVAPPTFATVIQDATLQQLLSDAQETFPGFLGSAVRFSDLFRPYAPHLAGILSTYAPGLGVLGQAVRGGQLLIEGIPQDSTRCDYGTPRRAPRDPKRRPLVTRGHCPSSQVHLQRGAAHAPGPVG